MRGLRTLVLGLLALALAGCFVSSEALIAPEEAEPVFDGRSAYSLSHSTDGGATWTEAETGTIARSGDFYVLDGESDSAFTLRSAFGDYYIAQQAADGAYYYDLLRVDGDRVYVYGLVCEDEDEANVEAGLLDGISGEGDGLECGVSDFARLAQVFAARVAAGAQPKSLYIFK